MYSGDHKRGHTIMVTTVLIGGDVEIYSNNGKQSILDILHSIFLINGRDIYFLSLRYVLIITGTNTFTYSCLLIQ